MKIFEARPSDKYFQVLLDRGLYKDIETSCKLRKDLTLRVTPTVMGWIISSSGPTYSLDLERKENKISLTLVKTGKILSREYPLNEELLVEASIDFIKALTRKDPMI